jgi:hypothetical protein
LTLTGMTVHQPGPWGTNHPPVGNLYRKILTY